MSRIPKVKFCLVIFRFFSFVLFISCVDNRNTNRHKITLARPTHFARSPSCRKSFQGSLANWINGKIMPPTFLNFYLGRQQINSNLASPKFIYVATECWFRERSCILDWVGRGGGGGGAKLQRPILIGVGGIFLMHNFCHFFHESYIMRIITVVRA